MSSSFDTYKKRLTPKRTQDTSLRQSRVDDSLNMLEYSFEDDPSYNPVVEIVGDKTISARINGYTKEGFLQPKMKIQSTMENEFDMGDLIHFNDSYWLCTMKQNFHNIHFRGEIIQCNYMLRYQLPNDNHIHENYVVAERPYSQNLSLGSFVQLSKTEYRIRMQLTDITKQIYLKQRFIMGIGYDRNGVLVPDVYTVDSRDGTSNAIMMEDGFLVLNFMKAAFNPETDNAAEMIADYQEIDKPPVVTDYTCVISSNSNIVRVGHMYDHTFIVNLYDDSGNVIEDISSINITWDIDSTPLQDKYMRFYLVDDVTINIMVEQPYDNADISSLIGSKFKLRVSADDSGYTFNGDELVLTIASQI